MQRLAGEMNLSETAFVWPLDIDAGNWSLRWFTPVREVDLCGHATLAAAFVLWRVDWASASQSLHFLTRSGWLESRRDATGSITLDFPLSQLKPASSELRTAVGHCLDMSFRQAWQSEFDLLVEVASVADLVALRPNLSLLAALPVRGLIVTARGDGSPYDFQSRFFAPACGVAEDPVTGSAHCALGPYWAKRLEKSEFLAYQASSRGGEVGVRVRENRVELVGRAVAVSRVVLEDEVLGMA